MSREKSHDEVVVRLLGPAGPELSCEQCFEELDRYVEFEFAGADPDARIPGMRSHLDGCAACAEDYQSLRDLINAGRPPAETV